MILVSERDPDRILALAELVRRARLDADAPMPSARSCSTPSIGLALFDPAPAARKDDALKNAELAMAHSKRQGGNKIEVFVPAMRTDRNDRLALESDLRKAIERDERGHCSSRSFRLEDRTIAGFEARGALGPSARGPADAAAISSPSLRRPA